MKTFLILICHVICYSYILCAISSTECRQATAKYYSETAFTVCKNVLAGHDIYFVQNCPIRLPRLCIEPTPPGFSSIVTRKQDNSSNTNKNSLLHSTNLFQPEDGKIAFSNMTALRSRKYLQPEMRTGISMDCLKCWDYAEQKKLWSTYVDEIEALVGFSFSTGTVRTVFEFGCGSGGFMAEITSRGLTGICSARDIGTKDGSTSMVPYLRTVAARGLLAMHVSINNHQPFLSNSFQFIHCSWVLAYVNATPQVYSAIFIEWDRLLTPGGLVVMRGAWSKQISSAKLMTLWQYSKYLLETVLQWKLLLWKIKEESTLGPVLSFTALTPLSREEKDWSSDAFLREGCPECFNVKQPRSQ